MKRDWRLVATLPLLLAAAILHMMHAVRLAQWSMAWGGHDEETMQEVFGVIPPANCAYDCYGWGTYPGDYFEFPAIFFFLLAFWLIAWAWWKPKN
uniref:hypothetical protein n=1 Tax=Parerythrobacter lutipelagi TaxID=1964208 RepID=UPI0010F83D75|nr:hypothetical protein [Parerythrobacter lutipelagi]